MRKRDKTCAKATPEEPKREQRIVCLMSEEELRIVDRYLEKYKITNKSGFGRLFSCLSIKIWKKIIRLFLENMICGDNYKLKIINYKLKVKRVVDDNFYMKQALAEARKAAERGEVPVGAIVVCKERIIARAHNLTETLTDVTAHAEMQAITAAAATLGGKYLSECTLYVTVEPCVMCAGAIAWAQMGRLVFGAEDEKRGYQRYAPQALHPKTVVVKGILADDCAALMKDFFAAKRR